MISEETLDRVRDSADIVQIIGEWVKLKRAGHSFRGPCPFHQGKGPNFAVVPDKRMYYCFVCHESGDVFKFVQKKLGLDWVSAVKLIGEKSGIEVIDTPTRPQAADPNAKHWEVLASAAEWFRAQLTDPAIGAAALAYLTARDLDAVSIARFELGYAPRDDQALRKHLHALGFTDARQIDAGILRPEQDGREPRINFRDRVMFPIVDERGNYVGFGGRALGDAVPKYLNSAASDVFQKGRTLYGMHAARHAMRRERRAVVVEGYMDAIRVALSGIETVVAPLGTALTEEQAALLVRHAPDVYLLYDSDEAGQKATFRSALELLRHGARVFVVTLPSGEDPDTFTQAHGRAGLEAQIAQAIDVFDRQVQLLDRRGHFSDLSKRRSAIDRLLPTIRAAKDPLTKDLYLTRLADVTGVDKAVLQQESEQPERVGRSATRGSSSTSGAVEQRHDAAPPPGEWQGEPMPDDPEGKGPWTSRPRQQGAWKGRGGRPAAPEYRKSYVRPTGRIKEPAERALISAMLADRALVERIAERHGPADFHDARYSALFGVLLMAGPDEGLDQIAERVDDITADALRELVDRTETRNRDAVDVDLNLAKLDVRPIEQRLEAIKREMSLAPAERQIELQKEERELTLERNSILPIRAPRAKPKY